MRKRADNNQSRGRDNTLKEITLKVGKSSFKCPAMGVDTVATMKDRVHSDRPLIAPATAELTLKFGGAEMPDATTMAAHGLIDVRLIFGCMLVACLLRCFLPCVVSAI